MVDIVNTNGVAAAAEANSSNGTLIQQGAEGRIFLSELFGQRCVVKERFAKKYRVPALDEKLSK